MVSVCSPLGNTHTAWVQLWTISTHYCRSPLPLITSSLSPKPFPGQPSTGAFWNCAAQGDDRGELEKILEESSP